MKKEYDFSKGERGKFYRPDVELNIPVYLDPDVAKLVPKRARTTDAGIGAVVNEWLRKEIKFGPSPARKRKVRRASPANTQHPPPASKLPDRTRRKHPATAATAPGYPPRSTPQSRAS